MRKNANSATLAWVAFGGLIAVGVTTLLVRELPSIWRELRILRM